MAGNTRWLEERITEAKRSSETLPASMREAVKRAAGRVSEAASQRGTQGQREQVEQDQ